MSSEEPSRSEEKYKAIEYGDFLFQIPVRRLPGIDDQYFLFLSDVQAVVPGATALMSSDKLIPFVTDPQTHATHEPRRTTVTEFETVWQAHVPETVSDRRALQNLEVKLDNVARQLHRLALMIPSTVTVADNTNSINETTATMPTMPTSSLSSQPLPSSQTSLQQADASAQAATSNLTTTQNVQADNAQSSRTNVVSTAAGAQAAGGCDESSASTRSNKPRSSQTEEDEDDDEEEATPSRSSSPPPAFSTSPRPALPRPTSNNSNIRQHIEGEAPPSYETSILGNIQALTDKLLTFETHIPNRHKSPRWLARRREWLERTPSNIEQVAYQLVQLEMALLWTAVSEGWIQEREPWLTLVASARSERHLAAAMLNLERHTLVLDEDWATAREGWVNELLEMVVLPLTHA
ncbi:hypothetical protein BCR43DRAFT_497259 [Syncephalastrum racemosum]|uniref:Uncharacterized protein n=1 Tax=Syncephalastrum racemosum TaxID=13706 RepID=A0A1X2H5E5_SYNRA|nr:hypothetical protein BCR43DRAFT_497259 [Syncephalastrum racemosum]